MQRPANLGVVHSRLHSERRKKMNQNDSPRFIEYGHALIFCVSAALDQTNSGFQGLCSRKRGIITPSTRQQLSNRQTLPQWRVRSMKEKQLNVFRK